METQEQSRREYLKAWRLANHEKVRAYARAWAIANRGKVRAFNSTWARVHPEKQSARTRAWALAHPEKRRAIERKWSRANAEKCAAAVNARRARKIGNGGSHTLQEWLDKCALFANLCAYCGEAKPLTRDHKTPISRGGTDDISNIVPSCKPCNSRKWNRTAQEFLASTFALGFKWGIAQ